MKESLRFSDSGNSDSDLEIGYDILRLENSNLGTESDDEMLRMRKL